MVAKACASSCGTRPPTDTSIDARARMGVRPAGVHPVHLTAGEAAASLPRAGPSGKDPGRLVHRTARSDGSDRPGAMPTVVLSTWCTRRGPGRPGGDHRTSSTSAPGSMPSMSCPIARRASAGNAAENSRAAARSTSRLWRVSATIRTSRAIRPSRFLSSTRRISACESRPNLASASVSMTSRVTRWIPSESQARLSPTMGSGTSCRQAQPGPRRASNLRRRRSWPASRNGSPAGNGRSGRSSPTASAIRMSTVAGTSCSRSRSMRPTRYREIDACAAIRAWLNPASTRARRISAMSASTRACALRPAAPAGPSRLPIGPSSRWALTPRFGPRRVDVHAVHRGSAGTVLRTLHRPDSRSIGTSDRTIRPLRGSASHPDRRSGHGVHIARGGRARRARRALGAPGRGWRAGSDTIGDVTTPRPTRSGRRSLRGSR